MAYVITGATGHIGNNLVRHLLDKKEKVKVLVRKIDRSIVNLDVEYVLGDIFSREFLEENIHPEDIVIHLAGMIDIKNKWKEETHRINYLGTVTITDVCISKKVKRYIYCSSVDVIYKANVDQEIQEPTKIEVEKFKDNYPITKGMATQYVMDKMNEKSDFSAAIVYPSAVIGVNDWKPSSIGKVVKDAIDGKMQFGIRGGYNFIDVDDLVEAMIVLSKSDKKGGYILSGHDVTVFELYETMNKALGKKRKIWKIPLWLVHFAIPFVPYLSKFTLKTLQENHNYSYAKAKEDLNLQLTPFHKTIEKTISWFNEQTK